jgi:hypothetical protein
LAATYKKMKTKKRVGRPVKYPFLQSVPGDIMPFLFVTRAQAIKVRCAAHTLAHTYGWQFSTEIRRTDAGKFELTVTRVNKY